MLFAASPWQSAHDLLVAPALVFHSVSPSSTTSMAGLAVSSFCMARVSALTKSLSERRWSKGISAAGAAPAISVKVKTRAAGQLHLLPLPRGERAGVRGLGPLRRNPLTPTLSPPGRGSSYARDGRPATAAFIPR